MAELTFVDETSDTEQDLAGKVFVITGSLTHFDNRNQLKELIESRGGQVTGSVSAKTPSKSKITASIINPLLLSL